jgi:hypothetical protein
MDSVISACELRSALDERVFLDCLALSKTAGKSKYLDAERRLGESLRDAMDLELHLAPPLRILDIGTGPGYFPYVCKKFGHDCIGLDKPGMTMFEALRKWVGTKVIDHRISPRGPLTTLAGKFDVVTAFRCPFYVVRSQRRLFTIAEWSYFLDDLKGNLLLPSGSFHLKMNLDHKYEGLTFASNELLRFFETRGAALERRKGSCTSRDSDLSAREFIKCKAGSHARRLLSLSILSSTAPRE